MSPIAFASAEGYFVFSLHPDPSAVYLAIRTGGAFFFPGYVGVGDSTSPYVGASIGWQGDVPPEGPGLGVEVGVDWYVAGWEESGGAVRLVLSFAAGTPLRPPPREDAGTPALE